MDRVFCPASRIGRVRPNPILCLHGEARYSPVPGASSPIRCSSSRCERAGARGFRIHGPAQRGRVALAVLERDQPQGFQTLPRLRARMDDRFVSVAIRGFSPRQADLCASGSGRIENALLCSVRVEFESTRTADTIRITERRRIQRATRVQIPNGNRPALTAAWTFPICGLARIVA